MAAARKPANKVRIEIPPRGQTHVFEVDMNRVQEEIEEQLNDVIECWGDDFTLDSTEITLSTAYVVKEVKR